MNVPKNLMLAALAGLSLSATLSLPARAQATEAAKAPAASAAADMTEGEVRKIDKDTKKITLKHGEIKNLDMPGMTMVFQVRDAALLEQVKVGDKLRFRAEKLNGAFVVTEMQVVGR